MSNFQWPTAGVSESLEDFLEPFDIALAMITARLDFDQVRRDLARVGEQVNAQLRQIDGFVFMQDESLLVLRDFRDAVHDDPMFRPVVMALQGERSPRVHRDQLDLETVAVMNGLVEPPWSLDAWMVG